MSELTLHLGDCIEVMASLPANSVDAVVTDPPYGLEFMGKAWDSFGRGEAQSLAVGAASQRGGHSATPRCTTCGRSERGGSPCHCAVPTFTDERGPRLRAFETWCGLWAVECLRVLKPGGHILAFGGSRTWHRLASAIEDAGFELRDSIAWLYGSGFPKSLDVSKAIDKAADYRLQARLRRAAVVAVEAAGLTLPGNSRHDWTVGDHAPGDKWWAEFQRWLPGLTDEQRERVEGEIVAVVRKSAGWFTRRDIYTVTAPATAVAQHWQGWGTALKPAFEPIVVGRKPLVGTVAANVLAHGTGALNIDGCRIGAPDDKRAAGTRSYVSHGMEPGAAGRELQAAPHDGLGRWPANVVLDESQVAAFGMARFFYVAKAAQHERPQVDGSGHPTVKPLTLMRWLARLVTPPGGTVLEPFLGSGTTAEACLIEGFDCIGIERDASYMELAKSRLSKPIQPDIFGGAA